MTQIVTSENIESILLNGESETVEFKAGKVAANSTLPKLISAFANTKGGIIIYGYMEMGKSIVGTAEKDFFIIKSVIHRYSLENLCNLYKVKFKDKILIILQVEKSESVIIAGGGAYIRNGECITELSSQEVMKRITDSLEKTDTSENKINNLAQNTEKILEELERQKNDNEQINNKLDLVKKELGEAKKERDEVNNKLIDANNKLDEAKKDHKKELQEAQIEHGKELKQAQKNNWIFAIISAIIGWLLSSFINFN